MKEIQGLKMFSKVEVAQLLGATTYFVDGIIKGGKIRYTRIGRGYYVSEEALLEYLKGEKATPKQDPKKGDE